MSSDHIDLGPNAAQYIWINSLVDLSAAVVLYYDYMLTLRQEIEFLWPPHNKQGWFTLACFLNRYLPVIGLSPIVASYFIPVTSAFCEGLHTYHEWLVMVVQTQAGTLCLLRVYALYGRSRRVLGVLLFLGTSSFVTAMAALFSSRNAGGETIPVISRFAGCAQFTPNIGGRFAAIAWTGVLVFDSVIFSLTLYKAFAIGRGVRLLNVIVRDGTMYFSALFFMNLGNIMTLRFAPPLLKTSTTTFTNVISTTLVTRLVLNLRERAVSQLPTTVETERRFQAGLPVARRPVQSPSSVRPNRSAATVPGLGAGESRSQSQSADAIGYESGGKSQASLPAAQQQVTSVRSSFSVRANRSTASVGTAITSRRSADGTGEELQSSR